jgi:hypothetical protein
MYFFLFIKTALYITGKPVFEYVANVGIPADGYKHLTMA